MMEVNRDGEFAFEISHDELSRGLRPSKRTPRNAKYLVECIGAVGLDKVLQVIDDLNELLIDTAIITDGFPYPQVFVFPYMTVVCDLRHIYEFDGAALDLMLTVPPGLSWSMTEFFDFVYASNARVAVRRRAEDRTWEVTDDYPTAYAICNFKGQVLIIGPDTNPVTMIPTTVPPTTLASTTIASTTLAPTTGVPL